MLRKQFTTAVAIMEAARDDVLAFLHFQQEHWRKIWNTKLLERVNWSGSMKKACAAPT